MYKLRNIYFSAILSALVFCLLAGCGSSPVSESEPTPEAESVCLHQWSDADCLNASACSLCGKIQSEALGHDWAEANCESPEHCTRCSETRGEVADHSYGNWILDSDFMYHICMFCGQTEDTEIDYSTYLNQYIVGHWNLYGLIKDKQQYTSEYIPFAHVDMEICFYADGRVVSRTYEEQELCNSWSFDRGEYLSDDDCHVIYITPTETAAFNDSYFLCTDDQILYVITRSNGETLLLSNIQNEYLPPLLTGTWSTYLNDRLHSINFSEDRTFTADIDGEISGFWLPRVSMTSDSYSNTATIMLRYLKDGKEHSLQTTLGNFYTDQPQERQKDIMNLTAFVNDSYVFFSLDAAQALIDAQTAANSAHLGTWTSTEYNVYSGSGEEQGLSTDYSITFMEDGTFQANLHQPLEGQWKLNAVYLQYGQTCQTYQIIAPDIDESSLFTISTNGNASLFVGYATGDWNGSNYHFLRMTDEEIADRNALIAAAPTLVVGEWFSNDSTNTSGIFNEDGTFTICSGTGDAQTEVKGNWYFSTMNTSADSYQCFYDLETVIDAGVFGNTAPIPYRESNALNLTIRGGFSTLNVSSIMINGSMTNAEGLALRKETTGALAGHWSANTAAEYNPDTEAFTEVAGDFFLDIAEDGTFTGYAWQDIQGFWSYYDNTYGYPRYLFTSADGSQINAIFSLQDGVLTGSFGSYIVEFTH